MDDLHVDGNAIAGLLAEVFVMEATTMPRRCQSCGRTNPIGAHLVYRGAGIVLRCPACGDIALRMSAVGDRHIIRLEGAWAMDVPEPA